jgi:hypothetical protein
MKSTAFWYGLLVAIYRRFSEASVTYNNKELDYFSSCPADSKFEYLVGGEIFQQILFVIVSDPHVKVPV